MEDTGGTAISRSSMPYHCCLLSARTVDCGVGCGEQMFLNELSDVWMLSHVRAGCTNPVTLQLHCVTNRLRTDLQRRWRIGKTWQRIRRPVRDTQCRVPYSPAKLRTAHMCKAATNPKVNVPNIAPCMPQTLKPKPQALDPGNMSRQTPQPGPNHYSVAPYDTS